MNLSACVGHCHTKKFAKADAAAIEVGSDQPHSDDCIDPPDWEG